MFGFALPKTIVIGLKKYKQGGAFCPATPEW